MTDLNTVYSVPDAPRWILLALAIPLALSAAALTKLMGRRRWVDGALAALAALLSYGYLRFYLENTPREIDATAYYLQARAFAAGWLAWPLDLPAPAVIGRFILRTSSAVGLGETAGSQAGAAVIFPPGYPAILGIGAALGAPLAVGPAIAAALVVATMELCRCASQTAIKNSTITAQHAEAMARFAGCLSALCATLRYHTADTMSHGWAALCMTVAAVSWLRSRRSAGYGWMTFAGLATGWLFATRPVSASTATLFGILIARWDPGVPTARGVSIRRVLCFGAGLVPGIAGFLGYQWALTGSAFQPAQLLYYQIADGPPGCFAYGFGSQIGCLGEHGSFVRAYLPEGYGPFEALGTTARRLTAHLADPLNHSGSFGAVLLGGWLGRRFAVVRALLVGVLVQALIYAPFYFDGNTPAGGGRMLADILPFEHVLVAIAGGLLATRSAVPKSSLARMTGFGVGLVCLGFAIGGAGHGFWRKSQHIPLDHDLAKRLTENRALLFLDRDCDFNRAFDPQQRRSIARYSGDAFDELSLARSRRDQGFRFLSRRDSTHRLLPVSPTLSPRTPRVFNGASFWPPRAVSNGWTQRVWMSAGGESGRWLGVFPQKNPTTASKVVLTLPTSALVGKEATFHLLLPSARENGSATLTIASGTSALHQWKLRLEPGKTTASIRLPEQGGDLTLVIQSAQTIYFQRLEATP